MGSKLRGIALAAAWSAGLAACVASGRTATAINTAACPELRGGALRARFAADDKASATVAAFVQASGDLSRVAARARANVLQACRGIGQDLGVDEAALAGGPREACGAVAARIDAILGEGARASLRASVTPPRCEVSAEAYSDCAAACGATVDPGQIVARCDPGELSGTCEGTCQGRCEGVCAGECAGQCANRGEGGRCEGRCQGTCQGRCEGTCHARCEGTWKAPRCEADVRAPRAEAKCEASCRAHASLVAECTEPEVRVEASADAAEIVRLARTLEAHLPALVRAQLAAGQRIAADVETLARVAGDLPEVLGDAGARAAACVAASASAVFQAQASIRVSVDASASVTGRVSGGT